MTQDVSYWLGDYTLHGLLDRLIEVLPFKDRKNPNISELSDHRVKTPDMLYTSGPSHCQSSYLIEILKSIANIKNNAITPYYKISHLSKCS